MTATATQPEDPTAAAFVPEVQQLTFNGNTIEVRPLNVLQTIQISRSLKQVLPALDKLGPLLGDGGDGTDVALLVELLADFGEPLTEAVSIATGLPLKDVQSSRDMAGLIGIIAAIVRINTDFFAQQAVPHLAGLRNAAAASGAGPMPSPALSPPGTGA